MSDNRYSGFYRDGGSQHPHDAAGDGPEPEAERTMIRPRQVIFDRDGSWPRLRTSPSEATAKETSDEATAKETPDKATAEETSDEATQDTTDKPESQQRHHRTLGRSIGLTLASVLIPGLGLLGARPRWAKITGALMSLIFVSGVGFLLWKGFSINWDLEVLAKLAVRPKLLTTLTVLLITVALVWAWLVTLTHLLTRPHSMRILRRSVGALVVTAFIFVIAAPLAVGARYSIAQLQLLGSVFGDPQSTDQPPVDPHAENPWEGIPRVNILLLGTDSTEVRKKDNGGQYSFRTDTIMVASIDTTSGDLTLIQIPRNVQYTPFPEGSELAKLFPRGFRGEGGEGEWMVNAIWEKTVNGDYPQMTKAVGNTPYPGAEALKQGIQGITGLKMDYFVAINIDGLQELIDAMGGVSVNINRPVPIGGSTDAHIKPSAWIQPGPNQHLDGYHAMWYARGRYGTHDFDRMSRQSCLVNAVVRQANPSVMLTSYEDIVQASKEMVVTDIPQNALGPLVDLSFKVKDGNVSRLAFADGKHGYLYANPNFAQMRQEVQAAINPQQPTAEPTQPTTEAPTSEPAPAPTTSAPATPAKTSQPSQPAPSPSSSQEAPSAPEEVGDACAYRPQEDP